MLEKSPLERKVFLDKSKRLCALHALSKACWSACAAKVVASTKPTFFRRLSVPHTASHQKLQSNARAIFLSGALRPSIVHVLAQVGSGAAVATLP